jgi:hypothetical protein
MGKRDRVDQILIKDRCWIKGTYFWNWEREVSEDLWEEEEDSQSLI